jgi:TrmH family RNA methyltransferase
MTRISSPHNRRLQSVRRLAAARERKRSGRFFAEGEDLIGAAQRAGREPVEGFRVAGSALGSEGFHEVEPAALRAVSALASGTRVIGIYEQRWSEVAGPLCVYLHGVGDPGNVGTVLRAAQAFAASSVALGPGCADPHSPKAVRASMGAIFAVTLARVDDVRGLADAARWRRARGPAAGRARRLRARCADPDRLRVAERGDGRHRCAV